MNTLRQQIALWSLLALLLPFTAVAQQQVVFKSEVLQEVTVTENGKTITKLQPVKQALPGDEVLYRLSFANEGNEAASNLMINNPIPAHTWYRPGSAFGAGTEISVSVNGGQQYGQLEQLTVKLANGKERAATFKDVTHVRWAVNYTLQPGETGVVSYRATVQ